MPIKKISSDGTGDWVTAVENPDEIGAMGYASLSPDGTRFAYLYYRDTNVELRVVNIDGTDDHVIAALDPYPGTPAPFAWQNVAWGARYIAINVQGTDNSDGTEVSIRLVDEEGNPPPSGDAVSYVENPKWTNGQFSTQARLTPDDQSNEYTTPGDGYAQMTWTPSGRYLYLETFRLRSTANEGGQCIVRLDIEDFTGHNLAIIADGPVPNSGNGYVHYEWPALDPTGTTLCATVRSYPYGGGTYDYKLVLMDLDGSNETVLVENAAWAVWNSDGTKISAYVAQEGAFGGQSYYTPIVIDVGTSEVTVVKNDTSSYGNVGFVGDNTGHADSPFTMPQPTATSKVWFQGSSDGLVHVMNPDGTGDTLRDPRSAPNHVWLGSYDGNEIAASPLGDYVYFVDYDHSNIHKVYRSWNDCTHYRFIWESTAHVSLAVNNINVSWDGTKILIAASSNETYSWCGPNGEDLGAPWDPVYVDGPIMTVIGPYGDPWELLYAQSAMQCMSPDGTKAMVWRPSNNHVGIIDLATAVITDLGVRGWIAPSWSSLNKIAYRTGTDVVVIDGTTFVEEHRWSTSPAGSLNYVCMWNPAGTELIVDDNLGAIKRYQTNGTLLNTLAIYPSWPFGWS